MNKVFYIPNLGYWSATNEEFIKKPDSNSEIVNVGLPEGADEIEALKNLLEYEGYNTDKLMSESVKLEILISKNKDFLINMSILINMNIEIPQDAIDRFESLKNKISQFTNTAKSIFLKS